MNPYLICHSLRVRIIRTDDTSPFCRDREGDGMIRSSLLFPMVGVGVVVGAIASGMSVPEPAILILLGMGILSVAIRERRRKRIQEAERVTAAGRYMTHGSNAPIPLIHSARRWHRLQSPRKLVTPARTIVMALSNGIIFYGCGYASRDIPLDYDSGNKKSPFKGSGVNCPRIELSTRLLDMRK